MIPAVGQTVQVRFEDLKITAQVVDVKMAWGRPRLLIEPVAGQGQQWIELPRVVGLVSEDELHAEWKRHFNDARRFGRDSHTAAEVADVLTYGQAPWKE
jgi:hypothetical protein